jgi:hypothetical protein
VTFVEQRMHESGVTTDDSDGFARPKNASGNAPLLGNRSNEAAAPL